MPKFRTSVPMSELRDKMSDADKQQHATTYQASRGGSFPEPAKPVPGTPQK
ncbi:hypothetical protein [Streptomyces swartbergensis]|uniref:hypothetical protein n=1 Tax=Streptomyces swartbergensis TaxID=487165 RepID=UPI0013029511|nr:hypothetical protein [Streptomyces swartbergensis]